jgi:hypothetical protein
MSLTGASGNLFVLGQATTQYNSMVMGWFSIGAGSTSNYLNINGYSNPTVGGLNITAGGNVGIGTTNPATLLSIYGINNMFSLVNSNTGNTTYMSFAANGANRGFIGLDNSAGVGLFGSGVAYGFDIGTPNNAPISFCTNNAIRMTIVGNGFVGIGTTTPESHLHIVGDIRMQIINTLYLYYISGVNHAAISTNYNGDMLFSTGTSGVSVRFTIKDGGQVIVANLGTGPVYSSGGTLTSTNPSDPSLKNNIVSLTPSIDLINQLNPVQFNWIDTEKYGTGLKYGFLANEVQAIFPNIVSTWLDDKGNEKLGYDSVSLIPVLTSAIKQQVAQIATLESKIASLESKIASLESQIDLLQSKLAAQESKLVAQESQFNQLLAWAKTQGFQ